MVGFARVSSEPGVLSQRCTTPAFCQGSYAVFLGVPYPKTLVGRIVVARPLAAEMPRANNPQVRFGLKKKKATMSVLFCSFLSFEQPSPMRQTETDTQTQRRGPREAETIPRTWGQVLTTLHGSAVAEVEDGCNLVRSVVNAWKMLKPVFLRHRCRSANFLSSRALVCLSVLGFVQVQTAPLLVGGVTRSVLISAIWSQRWVNIRPGPLPKEKVLAPMECA